ncbi:MAG: glycine cleavage system protein GcvH [Gammaproteobacteria bacterium]|nr:glycine cleavage system protein GcvH [Gammaproteobacteria bacterium]
MSNVPANLKYSSDHEWVRVQDDGSVVIGITDHAQGALGDLVFVESPEAGSVFASGDAFGVVESVKAASDVLSPFSGEVLEANSVLDDTPELVNTDPYGDGWLIRMQPSDPTELDGLMDAAAYEQFLEDAD